MTRITIASFNVKNLIGPDAEFYEFQSYTPEEYRWKKDWLADQVLALDADIIGFQEIFEEEALKAVISEADSRAEALNADHIPSRNAPYRGKAIFRKLSRGRYDEAALAFAPNLNDGGPGQRRPGLALLSRLGFVGDPAAIQDLETPLEISFRDMGGGDGGTYRLSRLSRPILRARVKMGDRIVTIFNCHLKSKLGEHLAPKGHEFAPEENLLDYDPVGRAMGALRSGLRRMAEAWVLRREIVQEIRNGHPVIVMGDLNDNDNAVSSEIIAGEVPFKNYAWMLRHDAKSYTDRYSDDDHDQITEDVNRVRLHSAEKLFVRKSARDVVYTSAFGGVYESIDQILLSRHFLPDFERSIGEMEYFSVLNDHITDGSHPEAPYNKLASDHGQIMVQLRIGDADED